MFLSTVHSLHQCVNSSIFFPWTLCSCRRRSKREIWAICLRGEKWFLFLHIFCLFPLCFLRKNGVNECLFVTRSRDILSEVFVLQWAIKSLWILSQSQTFSFTDQFLNAKIFHLWWIQDWCVRKMMYPNEKWILWIWFLHLSRWLHSILKMLFLKRMSSGQRLLANFWVAAQQLVARFLGLLRF